MAKLIHIITTSRKATGIMEKRTPDLSALPITLADIQQARERIAPHFPPSQIRHFPDLGDQVYLKLECLNPTGSFKIRGALNAMLSLGAESRERGVVTASSGNHAQGIAYAAHLLGVKARIYMPSTAPQKKSDGVRKYGIEPILFGARYDDAEAEALRVAREEQITYVSPYNNRAVAAGQGTIGLEILDALPDVERVIVPVGGGGLISGIAVAIKSLRPDVQIIGANAEESPEMFNIFYGENRPCRGDILADALPGAIEPDSITIPITRALVYQIALVDENETQRAVRWMSKQHGIIVEGGGAVGIAVCRYAEYFMLPRGLKTAIVVSGGNIDADRLKYVLERDAQTSADWWTG